ncbi:phosphopantetheine-binding protein, partial [Streptomyces sp. SID13588]|uniref:phosphopantetheine-binding protein n=1 Tax=Streptomyces sp. SID13588 TaxID=2706051 RepID=UPI0013CBF002
DAFPLDANGKVDRPALLQREAVEQSDEPLAPGGEFPPEATASERLVLRVVRELLRLPQAAPDDNFTDLGGTSLDAARLLAVVEAETSVRLRAPELLRQPSLRAMAAVLDKRSATAAANTAAAGRSAGI